jgi:hypothetical protein
MSKLVAAVAASLVLATTAQAAPSKQEYAQSIAADYLTIVNKIVGAADAAGKDCGKLAAELGKVEKTTAAERGRVVEAKSKAGSDAELRAALRKATKAIEPKVDANKLKGMRAACGKDKAVMDALKSTLPRL